MFGNPGDPPIDPDDAVKHIASELEAQLGWHFVGVGQLHYDGEANAYHAEVFYRTDGRDRRHVMSFIAFHASNRPNAYIGAFPRSEIKPDPKGMSYYPDIVIDSLMNE